MSALRDADERALCALGTARAAGISVAADGEDLVLKAAAPPSPELIEALSRHKVKILKLLRREIALEALRDAVKEVGRTVTGDSAFPDGVRPVHQDEWFTRWHLRTRSGYRNLGSCMAAFQRVRKALIEGSVIGCSGKHVWIRR